MIPFFALLIAFVWVVFREPPVSRCPKCHNLTLRKTLQGHSPKMYYTQLECPCGYKDRRF